MSESQGHDFPTSFDPARNFSLAWRGVKLNPVPMLVGGLLMQCTSGGSGGGGNIGRLGDLIPTGEDDGYDNSSGGDFQWQERLGQPLEQLGTWLQGGFWRLQEGLPPELERMLEDLGGAGFSVGLIVGIVIAALCCGLVIGLALAAANAFLSVGWYRMHQDVLSTGRADLGRMFGGGDRFMPLFLWRLLKGLISFGVALVFMLPGGAVVGVGVVQEAPVLMGLGALLMGVLVLPAAIFVGLGLAFGDYAVVFEGLGVMEALERSWSVANGNRLQTLIFGIVGAVIAFLLAVVGLCMCFVGMLITLPLARAIVDMAWLSGWLMHTRPVEETNAWKLPELG